MLGGRAPAWRWGQGSLQEIDHIPFVRPLVKFAATADSPGEIQGLVDEAIGVAMRLRLGPAFLDFPLDHVFSPAADSELPAPAAESSGARPAPIRRDRAGGRAPARRRAARDHGRDGALLGARRVGVALARRGAADPGVLNGLGRGCLPADHELCFSRARSAALKGADVALVIGVPLDFRLGFGATFGDETELIVIDVAEPERPHPRAVSAELYGALPATLGSIVAALDGGDIGERQRWVESLSEIEASARAQERGEGSPTGARRCTRCGFTASSSRCSTATRS